MGTVQEKIATLPPSPKKTNKQTEGVGGADLEMWESNHVLSIDYRFIVINDGVVGVGGTIIAHNNLYLS